jgi:hypothetical protein
VSSEQMHLLLGNFYLKINRPLIPTRFFRNRDQALTWMQKMRDGWVMIHEAKK